MKYLSFLLVIALSVLLSRCFYCVQSFNFKEAIIPQSEGRINVFVGGRWKELGGWLDTERLTSPYHLVVAFESQDEPGQPVSIQITKVTAGVQPINGATSITDPVMKPGLFCECTSRAVIMQEGLELPYEELTVEGKLTYRGKTSTFSTVLTTQYSWEIRNKVWDALMSV